MIKEVLIDLINWVIRHWIKSDSDQISDGDHTFEGLYEQRMILFVALTQAYPELAWKSWKHSDGELCFGGGWFIVGIETPKGNYTYHFKSDFWKYFKCEVLTTAPVWDGHNETDAARRLWSLSTLYRGVNCMQCSYDKLGGNADVDDTMEAVIDMEFPNTDNISADPSKDANDIFKNVYEDEGTIRDVPLIYHGAEDQTIKLYYGSQILKAHEDYRTLYEGMEKFGKIMMSDMQLILSAKAFNELIIGLGTTCGSPIDRVGWEKTGAPAFTLCTNQAGHSIVIERMPHIIDRIEEN